MSNARLKDRTDYASQENEAVSNSLKRRAAKKRFTLLVFIILFVFCVLCLSLAISGGLLMLLDSQGFMKPITENRLPAIGAFILIASLLTGVIISAVAGSLLLRPVKRYLSAIEEVAAGNFDIRIEAQGPAEFSQLTTSFNKMAAELGSIETLRSDFVNNISHEYKTPIVSIRGFAKLLKRDDLPAEKREEYLDIIIAESDRLAELSNNVLLLSKLENTERLADTSSFSLDEQLRQVVLLLDHSIDEKELEMSVELTPCLIESSEDLLQQVWINLLNNAVKFTPAGGTIEVSMQCADERAHVCIADTGIGMTEEDLGPLFDKFYQGEGSRSSEGNGLGLPLVRRILELCKGTITIESEPGKGSVFTVTLPLRSQ